jgi:hypothetical protein
MSEARPNGEPADPLLRAVAEYWHDILGYADEEQAARLLALIAGTAESDPVEARAALGDELLDLLPAGHPVIRAMRAASMYSPVSPDPRARQAAALRWLRAQLAGGPAWPASAAPGDRAAELDEFDRQVRARLLSLPSLTAEAVRASRVDPGSATLIRLTGPDRQVRLPAFQFRPDGRPWPVVQEVNERLGAAADPWGVTCWWVDPHQRLAASPQELLGRDSDELLRRAAAAVGEDWLCRGTIRRRTSPPGRGSSGCRPGRSCGGSSGSTGRPAAGNGRPL